MRLRLAALLVSPVALMLLAGCGGDPASAAAPSDGAACEHHAATSPLVRHEADVYAGMPVPPVRVALALATTWEFYLHPGAVDPDLRAAMAEVAAAIGDLDAQGRAAVAPGATLMDPVRLDPSRTLTAVDAVDRACAGALTR
ncbi:hypothetical protein [Pseudonocardia sp.]|uniref:hypothetical protein n=1 Tax=Pseudonocardia sp. TaxID=60912 RepID=UPI003D0B040B